MAASEGKFCEFSLEFIGLSVFIHWHLMMFAGPDLPFFVLLLHMLSSWRLPRGVAEPLIATCCMQFIATALLMIRANQAGRWPLQLLMVCCICTTLYNNMQDYTLTARIGISIRQPNHAWFVMLASLTHYTCLYTLHFWSIVSSGFGANTFIQLPVLIQFQVIAALCCLPYFLQGQSAMSRFASQPEAA